MFYFAGISLSLFLFLLLVTKRKKKKEDYVLCAWLVLSALDLTTYYLHFSALQTVYPTTVVFGVTLPLLQGPFLYLYILERIEKRWSLWIYVCFLPFFASNILFLDYYLLPFDARVAVIENKGKGFENEIALNEWNIYVTGVALLLLSAWSLFRYRSKILKEYHSLKGTSVNWLTIMIVWMAMIWMVVLTCQNEVLIYSALTTFIIWLGYSGIKHTEVFSSPERDYAKLPSGSAKETSPEQYASEVIISSPDFNSTKYQNSNLTDEKATEIHKKLKKILQEDHLYKDPDLHLNGFAKLLEIHPNNLSQVINDKEQKSFHQLINEMRVKEFTRLASQSKYSHLTLLAIAFDCGFNSKAAFNRNFKKHTGITPREFMKQTQV